MKKLLFILLIAAAFVIEAKWKVLGVRLNLIVLFAYYTGLKYGPSRGLLVGLILGAVEDSIAGPMLGPSLLGKATAGYLAPFITYGLFIWTAPLGLVWLLLLTVLDGAISFFALSIFSYQPAPVTDALLTVLWQGLIVCPVGLFLRPRHDEGE